MNQSDPRFLSTLHRVLKTPDKGGLTSNVSRCFRLRILLCIPRLNFDFRVWYIDTTWRSQRMVLEVKKVLSRFARCGRLPPLRLISDNNSTFRCVEALTRAGATDRKLLLRAVAMFEVTMINFICSPAQCRWVRISFCISTTSDFVPKKYLKREKRK